MNITTWTAAFLTLDGWVFRDVNYVVIKLVVLIILLMTGTLTETSIHGESRGGRVCWSDVIYYIVLKVTMMRVIMQMMSGSGRLMRRREWRKRRRGWVSRARSSLARSTFTTDALELNWISQVTSILGIWRGRREYFSQLVRVADPIGTFGTSWTGWIGVEIFINMLLIMGGGWMSQISWLKEYPTRTLVLTSWMINGSIQTFFKGRVRTEPLSVESESFCPPNGGCPRSGCQTFHRIHMTWIEMMLLLMKELIPLRSSRRVRCRCSNFPKMESGEEESELSRIIRQSQEDDESHDSLWGKICWREMRTISHQQITTTRKQGRITFWGETSLSLSCQIKQHVMLHLGPSFCFLFLLGPCTYLILPKTRAGEKTSANKEGRRKEDTHWLSDWLFCPLTLFTYHHWKSKGNLHFLFSHDRLISHFHPVAGA